MNAEPELFQHGIFSEKSDIRAHVGVIARTLFVFKTTNGLKVLDELAGKLLEKPAYQPGVCGATAKGYCVPLAAIPDLRQIKPHSWPHWCEFSESLTTTAKGELAVRLVCWTLANGRFPLWLDAYDDERKNIQIQGTDIVLFARKRIQVKCDYRAGPKTIPGCTGNIYLQTAERNPLKRH